MRSRSIAVGIAAALLAVAGCTEEKPPAKLPPVSVVQQPAASAGGACILWDYGLLKKTLGVTFTVAASQSIGDTSTCVVQTEGGDAPYLVLSVVESTKADAATFLDAAMPAKATKVKGLGKAGYRLVRKPARGYGHSIEIGWLSDAGQVQTLTYTFAKGAPRDQVDQGSARLVSLAKALSTTAG
ncbi:hypothetical protein [Jidongwangia harbinensis]|uniref:hypothetical protein n=1 Tax=Jidongwangia harbinensis TaxID=2878561 RepID=UPI001CDA39CA|nr:hypothetical protein [Jidongwangia harbinensis]MCA2215312.1 hypothetical protein [Jidongwangia harbinensis]